MDAHTRKTSLTVTSPHFLFRSHAEHATREAWPKGARWLTGIKEGKWKGQDDWQNLAWKVARRLKSCPTGLLFFSYHPRALLGPRFSPTERRKGISQSLTIENKIDWFRRSGFGDLIGLTRFRQSSLFFSSSLLGVCSQDDLKTVFRKIHTQMINRYRIWRSLSRIRTHYISCIRSGLSGKHYSPFSWLELTAFSLNWLIFGRVLRIDDSNMWPLLVLLGIVVFAFLALTVWKECE